MWLEILFVMLERKQVEHIVNKAAKIIDVFRHDFKTAYSASSITVLGMMLVILSKIVSQVNWFPDHIVCIWLWLLEAASFSSFVPQAIRNHTSNYKRGNILIEM